MDNAPLATRSARARWWIACILLVGSYLCLRLPNLRNWPMFCDEATYARWAQLVIADPVHNLWVSMEDAKPPIHAWLLALTRWFAQDPITAGRLLSVFAGAATIPFLLLLCEELATLTPKSQGRGLLLGTLASALMITSPLLALHQRMLLAESLLILEAVILAWLSLRLARSIAQNAPAAQLTPQGLSLGIIWAITLLTKQNFSYLLWSLPLAAFCAWTTRAAWRRHAQRFIPQYALATFVGLLLFIPVLFTDSTLDLTSRLFYKPSFYPQTSRALAALQNIVMLVSPRAGGHPQWWPYDAAHPLDDGWLYVYLTPPILLLVVAGCFWMAHRRAWRTMLFCGVWTFALLGMLALIGGQLWSRYLVLGIIPLLLIAAWFITDLLAHWRERIPPFRYALLAGSLVSAVLAWPAFAVAWSARDWRAPTLIASDVGQYVTRQCAGPASEQAALWCIQRAKQGPIAIVTGSAIGLPNDLLWLALQNQPNIRLYWDKALPPLQPAGNLPNTYWLGSNRWIDKNRQPVSLPPGSPIYLLVPRLRDPATDLVADVFDIHTLPPGAHIAQIFMNPSREGQMISQLLLIEVPPSISAAASRDPFSDTTAMLQ